MEHIRKLLGAVLTACMILCLILQLGLPAGAQETETAKAPSEYRWITKRDEVDGSDYTDIPALAETLNGIFDGNANIYYDAACTNMVDTELGTRRVPNNGVYKYVGIYGDNQTDVGTSCWIYANGVYFTLFGEGTGCGTAGENSEKLDLSTTAHRNFTYDNFTAWGVHPGVGALIRTTSGHSLIVLGYDSERLTILDGNGDGKGLIAIRVITWDRLGFRAKYIIQPTETHREALYPQNAEASETPGVITLSSTRKETQAE